MGRNSVRATSIGAGALVVTVLAGCQRSRPPVASEPKIAFVSEDREQNCSIWLMNVDGSHPTRLVNRGDYFAWAPDGSRVAFLSGRAGEDFELRVANADGSGRMQLSRRAAGGAAPSWSPDGTRLAFVSGDDIWVVNADGSDLLNLSRDPGFDSDPAWSPDGAWIAFHAARGEHEGIFVVKPDGTGLRRLADSPMAGGHLRWSPDGTMIAFARFSSEDREMQMHTDVWVRKADGSDQRRLVESAGSPEWSPDGRTIACVQGDKAGMRIYTVSPEGGDGVPLTGGGPGSHDQRPSWSPDGSKIAYYSESRPDGWYDIFVVNADGTNLQQLTHAPTLERNPAWQPQPKPTPSSRPTAQSRR